jgi:hypothetical protein
MIAAWKALAACGDRELLPLVDAAFDRPGGPAGRELRKRVCPTCPVIGECLEEAMLNGEYGVWGGTSQNWRTMRGSRNPRGGGHG